MKSASLPQKAPPPSSRDQARQRTLRGKHLRNLDLAQRLRNINRDTMADELAKCHAKRELFFCAECGEVEYRPVHCRQRLCAICGPAAAAAYSRKLRQYMAAAKNPKFITLTMPRSPDLGEGIDKILKAFRAWRYYKAIRRRLIGGAYKLEAKPKEDGWHVHLHIVADALYIPQKVLVATWGKAIGYNEPNVDIRRIDGPELVRDHCKYAAKADDVADWTDGQLEEWLDAMHNRRTLQTFGAWHGLPLVSDDNPESEEPPACPRCGRHRSMYPIRAGPYVIGDGWAQYWAPMYRNLPEYIDNPDVTGDESEQK